MNNTIIRGYANQIISRSQVIYQWLIVPLEPYLENNKAPYYWASMCLSVIGTNHQFN